MCLEGKLTLIGAGPGDVELITLKGIRALSSANVVLYDALVNTDLLEFAPEAEKYFVGKRKGCAAFAQEQIHELIVALGKGGKHVVRLKGGDPFVFGRGSEEINYAASRGMEIQIIPGISSCLAVPAAFGIPVTQRGVAESFWVVTGTTKNHQLSKDIARAARSSATVVILMGMSKIKEIMSCFLEAGRMQTQVAVIQEGTTPAAKIAIGTVGTITSEVKRLQLSNPAIIIVGEVVSQITLNSARDSELQDRFKIKGHGAQQFIPHFSQV